MSNWHVFNHIWYFKELFLSTTEKGKQKTCEIDDYLYTFACHFIWICCRWSDSHLHKIFQCFDFRPSTIISLVYHNFVLYITNQQLLNRHTINENSYFTFYQQMPSVYFTNWYIYIVARGLRSVNTNHANVTMALIHLRLLQPSMKCTVR